MEKSNSDKILYIDNKKAEVLFGVGVRLNEPAISILNNPSATDSIADLKNNFNVCIGDNNISKMINEY